jgi:hypothetical protein
MSKCSYTGRRSLLELRLRPIAVLVIVLVPICLAPFVLARRAPKLSVQQRLAAAAAAIGGAAFDTYPQIV